MMEHTTRQLPVINALLVASALGKPVCEYEVDTANGIVFARLEKPESDVLLSIQRDDTLRAVMNAQQMLTSLLSSARRS